MSGYRPQRPELTQSQDVYGLQDAVEHLGDVFDTQGNDVAKRRSVRACVAAFQELVRLHGWSHYKRRGSFTLSPMYQTGTVTYDHATLTLTLDGGVFPADAEWFTVIIGNTDEDSRGTRYRVATRVSDTAVTFRANSNPGADIDEASTYLMFRTEYPLPADVSTIDLISEANWVGIPMYASPQELYQHQSHWLYPQDFPSLYTIRNSEREYAGKVIEVSPPPVRSRVYEYHYVSEPQNPRLFRGLSQYTSGTVSTSGTTVTGVSTKWDATMVGCLLRVSENGTAPAGMYLAFNEELPFLEQRVVMSVASATSLTVDVAFSSNYSSRGHAITSVLDLDVGDMLEAYHHLCEAKFARLSQHKTPERYEEQAYAKIRMAKANDYKGGTIGQNKSVLDPLEYSYATAAWNQV